MLDQEIAKQREIVDEKETEARQSRKELEEINDELKKRKSELKELQKKYENMCIQKQQNYDWCMYYKNMAEAIQASRSYRLTQKIKNKLIPVGSRRRNLAKKMFRAVRPVKQEKEKKRRSRKSQRVKALMFCTCRREKTCRYRLLYRSITSSPIRITA